MAMFDVVIHGEPIGWIVYSQGALGWKTMTEDHRAEPHRDAIGALEVILQANGLA